MGADYNTVLDNIKKFQEIKKEMNKKKPILRVQMVDMPETRHEIEGYKKFWDGIAEDIGILNMINFKGKVDKTIVSKEFQCPDLWQRLVVTYDGDVLMCCGDYKGSVVLGNVNREGIEDIWSGDKLNKIRNLHIEGRSHEVGACRNCEIRARMIELNKK